MGSKFVSSKPCKLFSCDNLENTFVSLFISYFKFIAHYDTKDFQFIGIAMNFLLELLNTNTVRRTFFKCPRKNIMLNCWSEKEKALQIFFFQLFDKRF